MYSSDEARARAEEKPWKLPLKMWTVTDKRGMEHILEAHFAFDNGHEGLVFRRYMHRHTKTTVVAAFAAGSWEFYKEVV